MKGKRRKILITVSAVLLFVIFATLVLPSMLFPLRLDISGHVFHVGDTMSGIVTFTNKSGQDVNIVTHGGHMPCVYVHSVKETGIHTHLMVEYREFLEAGDKKVLNFVHDFTEPGIYLVEAHTAVSVNNYPLWGRAYSIVIVLE